MLSKSALSPEIRKFFEKKFQHLDNGWISLMLVPVENILKVNTEAIKLLQERDYKGIYISLSKDYLELSNIFKSENIDLEKLHFIDGISQMFGVAKVDRPNVTYVDGPLSIESIQKQILAIEKEMPEKKKFLFLDSITTVLLYNSLEKTLEFSNFLTTTLKNSEMIGILVSLTKGYANDQLIEELKKASDEVLDLNQNMQVIEKT